MSPQVPQRPPFSPSTNLQPGVQRYAPAGGQGNMAMSRYAGAAASQNPGPTGYHTVIPEAQQQQIIDQAKARVAAQERSAMFADKMTQPGGYGAAARASMAGHQQKPSTPGGQARQGPNGMGHVPPRKVTPVPVPVVPGSQQQRKASDS
ncbi:hypothetical protein XA68_16278 [Ophiocordyceps unilateralis]|uniref:Uncharacterized protein n=1 Tax=Ophiocordyceps unilateralis TaxID=268505 RepID=A0A2A9P6W1_OPHUN|nr:hypothetical protein XA68_16278 [Ophiocordyceps unilateralis]